MAPRAAVRRDPGGLCRTDRDSGLRHVGRGRPAGAGWLVGAGGGWPERGGAREFAGGHTADGGGDLSAVAAGALSVAAADAAEQWGRDAVHPRAGVRAAAAREI